jgi:hypothetical protein
VFVDAGHDPAADPLARAECGGCLEVHLLDRTTDTYRRAVER